MKLGAGCCPMVNEFGNGNRKIMAKGFSYSPRPSKDTGKRGGTGSSLSEYNKP